MGATVTITRRAAAFRGSDAQTYYVLFEETYDKRTHPHTPSWDCVGFGTVGQVLHRIFRIAGDCEGGMLQNRSGAISPEGYVATWMKTLASPARMPDRPVSIRYPRNENDFYAEVLAQSIEAVEAILNSAGRGADVETLRSGEAITFQLHADANLLSTLSDAPLYVSRLISGRAVWGLDIEDTALGYKPDVPKRAALTDLPLPEYRRLGQPHGETFVLESDGCWRLQGADYSVVSQFVRNYGPTELAEPGRFCRRVRKLRTALAHACAATPQTVDVNDVGPYENAWEESTVTEVRRAFASCITPIASGFRVQLPATLTLDQNAVWWLTHLPRTRTNWTMSGEAANQPHVQAQDDLFGRADVATQNVQPHSAPTGAERTAA